MGTGKTTAPALPHSLSGGIIIFGLVRLPLPHSRTERLIKVGVVQLPLPQSRTPEVEELSY